MKYNEFTYVQPTFQERIAFEHNSKIGFIDDPLGNRMFDRLMFHYQQFHTYKELYFKDVDDFFGYLMMEMEYHIKHYEIGDMPGSRYIPIIDFAREVVAGGDAAEYVKARLSYLWKLFRLADKGKLPDFMPMTNTFNPANKYVDLLKKNYEDDYKNILILCGETRFPDQVVNFNK